MIYKTLHKKLNIEQTNPTKNRKWCDPEEKAVSAPYVHACGAYHDFPDGGLLVTRKLLNQGFLVVTSKSSLRRKSRPV
jgi:hypothetical protein